METQKKYVMFVDETGTPKGNTQFNPVSYTHLTLPTTPYV